MAVTNLNRAKLALIGAALLGTALPATALAQREDRADWGHGGERRGGSGGGQAPQASAPRNVPAPQAAPAPHGGWQSQPQGNWAARPAPTSPVAPTAPVASASPNWAARGGGGNGGWNGGGWNRGAPQSPAAPQAAPAPQAPVAQAPSRRWDHDGGRGGNLANGTYQGRPSAPPAQPWPRDRNDWVNRGTAGVPHYATRDGDRWRDGARGWSREWRGDRRYDWQAWRGYHGDFFRLGRYYPPYRDWGYRRLGVGFVLDSLFWADNYWIADPFFYHLPPAYGPYRWVRYYDDALLVDTYSGQVVDVIYGVFW